MSKVNRIPLGFPMGSEKRTPAQEELQALKRAIGRNDFLHRGLIGRLLEPGTEFVEEDFSGHTFLTPNFKETVFRSCVLQGTRIYAGNLCGVMFIDCDLRGAQIIHCTALKMGFVNCKVHKACLSNSDLSNGYARKSIFTGVEYTGTVFKGFNFGESTWLSANTRGATDLRDAKFSALKGISDAHLFMAEVIRRLGVEHQTDERLRRDFKFLWGYAALPLFGDWYPGEVCWQGFFDLALTQFPKATDIFVEEVRSQRAWRTDVRVEMELWKREQRLAGRDIRNQDVTFSGYTFRIDELGAFRPIHDRRDELYVNVDETIVTTEEGLDPALEELRTQKQVA